MSLSGWFWARGLFLLAVACNAAWVLSGASRWSGLLVIAGGFAAVVAGLLVFTDAAGAGSDSARDYLRWLSRLPFYGRSAYWNNPRHIYTMTGVMTALLGVAMILIGFSRSVGSS